MGWVFPPPPPQSDPKWVWVLSSSDSQITEFTTLKIIESALVTNKYLYEFITGH